VLDRAGHIIGTLISPPVPGEEWASVVSAATDAIRAAREKMTFPPTAFHHRRAPADGEGFPTAAKGFLYGGGRQYVGNIKPSSQQNARALDELIADPSITRFATYPIPVFQALCFPIFKDYHETKQVLLQKNRNLHRTWARSPFTAVTVNLGPVSVSPPHTDLNNKADGMCLIGALGDFDPDQGGHLVCWEYNLIIRFPPGCSILIPSAVVTHSNTPIQPGEERFSLIQYSAGALFRWVDNGFKSDLAWYAAATAEDIARREEERQQRCAAALRKFTRWKDAKVRNYTGRARLDVWHTGELADFSDYTDIESEGSDEEYPPSKKARRT
ncbi:hypothetical protein DFH08DRAFT_682639, partial [Mycena albidolilacea]